MSRVSVLAAAIVLTWVFSGLCGDIAVVDTIFLAPRVGNGTMPHDVAVNSQTNKAYTANRFLTSNVSVIDVITDSVIGTLDMGVGSGPYEICANDSANRIYVTKEVNDEVSVIDGEADSVIATVSVASNPFGICVSRKTGYVYVTHATGVGSPLYIIDGASNAVVDSILLGGSLTGVCINDSTNMVYVARYSGRVYAIDGTTNSLVDSIDLGGAVHQVQVSKPRNRVYASALSRDLVYVIDGGTNTLMDSIAVATRPYGICVNDSTDLIYVTHMMDTKTVTIIDASSNLVVDTLRTHCGLQGIDCHSGLNRIYVAGYAGNSLEVIDGEVNSLDTLITLGILPFRISGNPVADRAYVTEYPVSPWVPGQFLVLDVVSGLVITKIQEIYHPYGMAVDPISNLLWVTNASDFVYIVDGSTNSVSDSIDIGSPSWGICRNDSASHIYVTCQDKLFFIESDSLVDTLSFGRWLEALDANESTGMVYITDSEGDSLYVVDGEACSLVAAVGVGEDPHNLWVNSATGLIYVSNRGSGSITVVDGSTNTAIGSILLPYPPNGITGSEGTNRIYVADSNSVLVIDGFTNLVVDSATFGTLSVMEWFNPETGRLYVTDMLDGWVYVLQDLVGVEERQDARSRMSLARLMQNCPNPFTRATTIPYHVASAVGRQRTAVSLSIYDVSGRLIRTLVDEPSNNPTIEQSDCVVWDGKREDGTRAPSGIYFYRLSCDFFSSSRKMVLLR